VFSLRRRNKDKKWLLFTRGLLDQLVSFIFAGRATYTAATRHLSADVRSLFLRRQDVVKLGTAVNKQTSPAALPKFPHCNCPQTI